MVELAYRGAADMVRSPLDWAWQRSTNKPRTARYARPLTQIESNKRLQAVSGSRHAYRCRAAPDWLGNIAAFHLVRARHETPRTTWKDGMKNRRASADVDPILQVALPVQGFLAGDSGLRGTQSAYFATNWRSSDRSIFVLPGKAGNRRSRP